MTASPTEAIDSQPSSTRVYRVEVRPRPGQVDPAGHELLPEARAALGQVASVHVARVYLIQANLDEQTVRQIADQLLADPVTQQASLQSAELGNHAAMIEVHYLPGVMDPAAESTREAIIDMLGPHVATDLTVRTGHRYDFAFQPPAALPDEAALNTFAQGTVANTVIEAIHTKPFWPDHFVEGGQYELCITDVPIRDLDDGGLAKLSRDGHLFLSVEEMLAIRDHYRDLGREPHDVELETLAQTWSEHCVHKTLKATVHYQPDGNDGVIDFANRPGHEVNQDGSVTIHNLLKQTIAAATFKLMETEPCKSWCVSVFEDNAGIVKLDDTHGVCIKVETHNHPSAIEPYGGAATGIGGCIRDVIGTGLAAKPIANTDTFCVAPPDTAEIPKGVTPPRRTLGRVMAGVRDYGNRMGIPTIDGAVYFHDDFLGNPLVFAGSIGLMPLDKCFGNPQPGDRIIALGGATGRDGIHGATFSSAELTDTHADEFSHAVQIGNPITEKKMLDVILRARDADGGPLFSAITDCGAGGFSSAVGEMGEKVGAYVTLETAPLKYDGLSYTEIWISEAQERMVLAVPADKAEQLKALCQAEDVSFCDLGHFGHYENDDADKPLLTLTYRGTTVGEIAMTFLHDAIPMPTRKAIWPGSAAGATVKTVNDRQATPDDPATVLKALLSHPNIASKHWIVRQYDHEVQGGSVIKPLVGPEQDGPGDAAVIRPKLDSQTGIAIACGLAPSLSEKSRSTGLATDGDSYFAALAAIDEAVRNAVCVGANPHRIALLDNFCWPSCDDPAQLGALVRAAEACHDAALAYETPFVSGKDSLNNQFTRDDGMVITIPQTLLISALGIVDDVTRCVTMDAKAVGSALILLGQTTSEMGGSHYRMAIDDPTSNVMIPKVNLTEGPKNARTAAKLIEHALIASAHDCSDGGLLVAAAEMAFAGQVGLDLELDALIREGQLDRISACFAETPSRYLLEVRPENLDTVIRLLRDSGAHFAQVGTFAQHDRLTLRHGRDGHVLNISLDELRQTWLSPLDW